MKSIVTIVLMLLTFKISAQVPQPRQTQESGSTNMSVSTPKIPQVTNSTTNNCLGGDCVNGVGNKQFEHYKLYGLYKNGVPNGWGIQTYSSGKYEGNFVNGKRNGFGLYKWDESGEMYHGMWKDGNQHGYGYVTKDKKITQAGYYENGKFVRNMGTDYLNNVKNGNCRGNCTNGFGSYTWDNGDYYEGFFVNSQLAHIGMYLYPESGSYIGAYANGKRNGFGIFIFSNKDHHLGMWENGNQHGVGVYKYEDTGKYKAGIWKNGSYFSDL